jgi:hypothetical protein
MAKRVLELRGPVNDIFAEMKTDSLLAAECMVSPGGISYVVGTFLNPN